jgi:hypothetical protein
MSENELYLETLGIRPSQIFTITGKKGNTIISINKSGIIGLIRKFDLRIHVEKAEILPFREKQSIALVEVTVTGEIDGKMKSAPGVASVERMAYIESPAYIAQTAMTFALKDAIIFLLGITDEDILEYAVKHDLLKGAGRGLQQINVSTEEKKEIEAVKIDNMDWDTV